MKNILLVVSGSIAAYKSAVIASGLVGKYNVDVIMTNGATKFITPLTLQTLTGNPVATNTFNEMTLEVDHIELAKNADLILIAPATANIIGKVANGIADDMASTVLAVSSKAIRLVAPAMNTNMYLNPIVQTNLEKLITYGWEEIKPKESLLACGDYGIGALADVEEIISLINNKLK